VLPGGAPDQARRAELGADGSLRLQPVAVTPLAEWVDKVHRTGGVPGDPEIGLHVMGIVSLLYALALVSGVLVFLPTLAKDLLALRIGHNLKRLWLDVHNLLGVASLPFHLIMALSAVVFVFHHDVYDLQDATIHRDSPVAQAAFAPWKAQPSAASQLLPPSQALARLRELAPEFQVQTLNYRGGKPAGEGLREHILLAEGHAPHRFLRGGNYSIAVLDAGSGALIGDSFLPGRQRGWSKAVAAFFSLHFGNFGSLSLRWAYFLLGLAGALVFYTGNLLWLQSRHKRARDGTEQAPPARSARYLAAATVGVSLGCVIGLSATIAAAHWITGRVGSLSVWHAGIYHAAFWASLAWAMWRGAAHGAVELLRAAAVVTALIPLATLLAQAWPPASALAGGPRSIAVELVAAVAAVALWWLAGRTHRRALRGGRESVWGYPGTTPAAA
jgi:uncharacterized iron-regulated membrane protein